MFPNLKKLGPLSLLLLALPATKAWNFVVFPDSECETDPPSGAPSGTGDTDGCQDTPANHKSFEISNMGSCELYLFAMDDDCENGDAQQFYDATNEDVCIPPDFQWDSYFVDC
jgi:hypothetical protein